MLILLSPAKRLREGVPLPQGVEATTPRLAQRSEELMQVLRGMTPKRIGKLMHISDALADLNHRRYQDWQAPQPCGQGVQPAVLTFHGDVYQGLRAEQMDAATLGRAQQRLRILSGLHGLLRPLDAILPYRLEMGSALRTKRGKTLYDFWGGQITDLVRQDAQDCGGGAVLNLASAEYAGAVQEGETALPWIAPRFLDKTRAGWRVVSFSAKRARGSLARWALMHDATQPEALREYSDNRFPYAYSQGDSTPQRPVFYAAG